MPDPLPDLNSQKENQTSTKAQGGSLKKLTSLISNHRLALTFFILLLLALLTLIIFLKRAGKRDPWISGTPILEDQRESSQFIVPVSPAIKAQPSDQATPSASPSTVYLELTSQDVDFLAGHEVSLGNPDKKIISLTFDGGASASPWPQIRDTLQKYGVKPTVFLTGNFIKENPDVAREMFTMGWEIGNHSTSHPDFTQLSTEQIKEEVLGFQREIQKALGFDLLVRFFRFPYGARNPQVLKEVANFGLQSVFWSKGGDSGGAANLTNEQVLENLRNNLRPGQIYLQHIGSTQDGQALDQFLKEVFEKGYQVVPVSQIITNSDQPPSILNSLAKGLNGPFVFKTK